MPLTVRHTLDLVVGFRMADGKHIRRGIINTQSQNFFTLTQINKKLKKLNNFIYSLSSSPVHPVSHSPLQTLLTPTSFLNQCSQNQNCLILPHLCHPDVLNDDNQMFNDANTYPPQPFKVLIIRKVLKRE